MVGVIKLIEGFIKKDLNINHVVNVFFKVGDLKSGYRMQFFTSSKETNYINTFCVGL